MSFEFVGLQGELEAAYKELSCVKNKLKHQEADLDKIRYKNSEKEDDFNYRYSECHQIFVLCIFQEHI